MSLTSSPETWGTRKKFLKQEGGRSREEARRPGRTADDPEIRLFSRRGDRTHRASRTRCNNRHTTCSVMFSHEPLDSLHGARHVLGVEGKRRMTSLSLIAGSSHSNPGHRSERKLQHGGVLTVATGSVRTAQRRHELLIIETQPVARRRAPTWKRTPSGRG